jgi:hypothetical protein
VHGSPRKVNEYLFDDKPTASTSGSPPTAAIPMPNVWPGAWSG